MLTNKAVAQHIVEEVFINGNITDIEALVAQYPSGEVHIGK